MKNNICLKSEEKRSYKSEKNLDIAEKKKSIAPTDPF